MYFVLSFDIHIKGPFGHLQNINRRLINSSVSNLYTLAEKLKIKSPSKEKDFTTLKF
jgi:hypothetical protein